MFIKPCDISVVDNKQHATARGKAMGEVSES